MGIRSLRTASISTGVKRSKVWDQSAVVITNSYESIATTTVGSGGSSTITFSSIPSTFKHLQIRYIARDTTSTNDANSTLLRFNGDTSYTRHYLYGDGNSVAAGYVSQTYIDAGLLVGGGQLASAFGVGVVDILDYGNTNKYKTVRTLSGSNTNATTNVNYVMYQSGLYISTSAISSIVVTTNGTAFAQHSQFALYGIRG
jgi:hypothetical protein